MSRQVDERVVSMQFDNKQFERNVSTTMSTLDKLKQKLHLDGATKGLENVGRASKNVNMSGLGSAVEQVSMKFSALQVMGVTALTNITNQAVNAGKRLIESLTVAPVKDGFSEYEMTLNAVQTTMAATGKTAVEVQSELKKLDEYADKTVYSTADMLNNLPKFTNAGVELETATKAMIGIANATALAGGDAGKASIAFYNLGQAIGTGYLTRMDYNSINNAGIATMEWKEQMVDAAIAAGTLTKAGDDLYEAGGKTFTMQQLFIDGLQHQWATTEVMLKVFGDYGDETTEIGKKSYSAAQDIKTFSMMMDSLKATAGTGWKDTWQLIFGDLDQAKVLWTGLSNFISGFITKMADWRNGILEAALGSPIGKLSEKLSEFGKANEKVASKLKVTDELIDSVINGEWGKTQKRWDALTKAGYDWAEVQNKVNERLGCSVRHVSDLDKGQENLTETQSKSIKQLVEMSDAQLKNLGFTAAEIKALRELEKQSEKTGIPIEDLINDMDRLTGRSLLINSFKNIWGGLSETFKVLKTAWQDVFPPKSIDERAAQLYNLIAAFHKFTSKLTGLVNENGKLTDTGEKLARTFKGVFAIIDVVTTVAGGGLKIAFKVLSAILSYFNLDILDCTAYIGDMLVRFRDWVDKTLDIEKAVHGLLDLLSKGVRRVKEFYNAFKETESFEKLSSAITNIKEALGNWFEGLKETDNIPKYLIQGFVNGVKSGLILIGPALIELGKFILETFRKILGIHSPSTETHEDGKNFVLGFVEGIKEFASMAWEVIKNFGSRAVEFLGKIDWGAVFVAAMGVGALLVVNKIANVLEKFAAPLEGIGEMFESLGDMFTDIGKSFRASAVKKYATAVLLMAVAIGILVKSIISLSEVESDKLWPAIGAIAVLSVVVAALAGFAALLGKIGGSSASFGRIAIFLFAMAGALFILVNAMKQLDSLGIDGSDSILDTLAGIAVGLLAVVTAFALLGSSGAGNNIAKVGIMLLLMSGALWIMVKVIKQVSEMDGRSVMKGLVVVGALELLIISIVAVSSLAGEHASKAGSMLLKMSVALLIMIGVMKLASGMNSRDITKGLIVIAGIETMFLYVVAVSAIAGEHASKAGSMLLKMSVAMLLMVAVIKVITTISEHELKRGMAVIAAFEVMFIALIAVSMLAGDNASQAGSMLLAMSGAMLIMAGVIAIISLIDPSKLWPAIGAISILMALFAGLIAVSKFAADSKGSLIAITVAISLLLAAMIGLTFIDQEKLKSTSQALSLVIGVFALLVGASKFAKDLKISSMITLVVVMVAAAAILVIMSEMKTESSIKNAVALSILMAAMSGVLLILSNISTTISKAIIGIVALTAMVIPLRAFVWILAEMSGVKNAWDNAVTLTALATALTLLLLPLSLIGFLVGASGGITLLGIAALALMIIPLHLLVEELRAMQNIQNATENTNLLINLMTSMTDMLFKISLVAPLAVIAVGAIGSMMGLMVALGVLATGIGWLLDQCPQIEEFLNVGIPIMEMLAHAIGSMIGNFVAGFTEGVASTLPILATQLSLFMEALQPFIASVKMVDDKVLVGAGILAAAIVLITAADFINGILSFMSGGPASLPLLGTSLSMFLMNAMPFILGASMINEDMMAGVKMLAETILILTAADVLNGLTSWFTGGSSLETFGAQIGNLGSGLKSFSDSLGAFSDDQLATVTSAAKAIKILAEAAKTIPNAGGLLADLIGDNELGTFAAQFPTLGTGLRLFLNNVGTFTDEQVATVTAAAEAVKILASASSEIPNTGGLLADLVGDNELGTFAAQFPQLGSGLADFLENIGTFSDDQVQTVTCAANAVKTLASASKEIPNTGGLLAQLIGDNTLGTFASDFPKLGEGLRGFLDEAGEFTETEVGTVTCGATAVKALAQAAQSIPNEGGWLSKIVGDNNLGTFASNFPSLGEGLAGFKEKIGTYGKNDIATMEAAVGAVKALTGLANADLKTANSKMGDFGKKIVEFGGKIAEFASGMSKISSRDLLVAVSSVNQLRDVIKNLAGLNTKAADNFKNAINSLGKSGVDKFVTAFTSNAAKTDVKNAGVTMVSKLIEGMNSKEKNLDTAAKNLATSAKDETKSNTVYDGFKGAGKYLVEGFAAGISANTYQAEAKAKAMAKAAEKAAKKALEVNSPSKVFRRLGTSIPEGFAMGIDKLSGLVSNSTVSMSDYAIDGVSDTISRLAKAVDSDMDIQPTIRPVLDLSDVKAGAGGISDLLNFGAPIGLTANVGSVSMSMGRRGQNGNGEVVSAINKLRKDLASKETNSYNINGLSYSGDADLDEAFKTIIRVAKIERRV